MIIGKWNKSVILTYVGLFFSILGIFLCASTSNSLYAISCLIISGICDLFDGTIARKCKRTNEEKKFGVELDSLVDAINFVALPINIFIVIGMKKWYDFIILFIFALCGIARLSYFNITVENINVSTKYYKGLPVTFTALIIPLAYLFKLFLTQNIFMIFFNLVILVTAILNVLNIKIKKPTGKAYLFFSVLAIIMLILYLGVL